MKKFLKKIFSAESSPHKLALAVTFGASTAASPFWGLQTWLLFPISWIFKLNPTISITILYLINNPWTMIPIAAFDYYVGDWFARCILHTDLMPYNPSFMYWINNKIGVYLIKYLGICELAFWNFVIGGLILSTIVALVTYPCALMLFTRIASKRATKS
ncbi:MAG: DUF2062 domain-containing protein [Candidatus Babeliaceae bacterium]|jgi:uncharacterized protein (DUF2062 family)